MTTIRYFEVSTPDGEPASILRTERTDRRGGLLRGWVVNRDRPTWRRDDRLGYSTLLDTSSPLVTEIGRPRALAIAVSWGLDPEALEPA